MTFNRLIESTKAYVAENDTTGAMLTVARYYGLVDYARSLGGIEALAAAEGYMPEYLRAYRKDLFNRMLQSECVAADERAAIRRVI